MFVGNLLYYLHIYNIVYIFTIQFTVHNAVYRVAATSSGIFAHCRILQVAWQPEHHSQDRFGFEDSTDTVFNDTYYHPLCDPHNHYLELKQPVAVVKLVYCMMVC